MTGLSSIILIELLSIIKREWVFEKIKAMQQLSSKDSGEADLKGLHELM